MISPMAIIIASVAIALLAIFLFIHELYPVDIIRKGRKVNIYVDGKFNREATISGIASGYLFVYERLPLPIHYRGKFYASGCMSDGHTILYLGKKKLYLLMRLAYFFRKIANTPVYADQMPIEDPDATNEPREEVEDEL
jgi:hypothetical protein